MATSATEQAHAPEQRRVLIAGAGYAGLHVAQRLGAWLDRNKLATIEFVDEHDYHQLLTELPGVVSGARPDAQVRVPLEPVLPASVRFSRRAVTGFDFGTARLLTSAGPMDYWRLVLALGSRPNDFDIPGLAERVLFMWSANDAVRIRTAVDANVRQAASLTDPREQARLLTVVIGGGGATGVELAGALAEELPDLARKQRAPAEMCRIILIEGGHTILAGSSPELIHKAMSILARLKVDVMTNSTVVEATDAGLRLQHGATIEGGTLIWAGGVQAPALVKGSGLTVGYNGRIKVDRYLRSVDHADVYAAGDIASVPDPDTGMTLPPLAQIALAEGETVAENLRNELRGRPIEAFRYRDKGLVVSVGGRRGVAQVGGLTLGGRLAQTLKDAIEWEYRQSVRHLRGWAAG